VTGRMSVLPAKACRFFLRGRCLYEERLNPGWRRDWRCKTLLGLEDAYERFLAQADNFQLEEKTAAGIWERRLVSLLDKGSPCGCFTPAPEPDPEAGAADLDQESALVGCLHLLEGLCVLELPECAGACVCFERRTSRDARGKKRKDTHDA
jgi:hypothetical protein